MLRLRPARPVVALALVVAVALGACGSDADIEQAQFATDLITRTGITQAEADCLTDKIYAEFDQAEVNRIYHAATEAEVGGDTLDTLDGFNAECITGDAADDEDTTTTTGDDASTTTADEGSTTTAADDASTTTTG